MNECTLDNVSEATKQQIMEVVDGFWKEFADRQVEKRFSYCADYVTFIGSRLNEKAANKEEYLLINRKSVEQFSGEIKMEFIWSRLSVLGDTAWSESEVNWKQDIGGKSSAILIRNTVVLKMIDQRWWIIHVHGSLPDFRLLGDNYVTNEETVLHNQELEREVYHRTIDLNKALENLKNTQILLIQSEKMASLGELTAGIAHEIQNPLNFVNNFSEVNKELLIEMKEAIDKGDMGEVKSLADDIISNQEKINHHGKRAEVIVKGMLQHSRTGGGQKEPTDINVLADEYLRLAYHGLRAKDKSFNSTFQTDFDQTIGLVDIIPQEIGRVVLNLITNAFYAVTEKSKQARENKYEPTVTVTTKRSNGIIQICVIDNGNGIPPKSFDKIFQPFYTTKPSGQGTGLGLSLSYDIVKAHDGEIDVVTTEGEGTVFTVSLPVK